MDFFETIEALHQQETWRVGALGRRSTGVGRLGSALLRPGLDFGTSGTYIAVETPETTR